jgi:two-component system, NarL family, nitrate/nitrite response regulator NarL
MRLLLADKQPIVLYGLEHLFAGVPDITVAAACTNGLEAMSAAAREAPDVAVMDADLPDTSGLEFLRAFHKASPRTNIVIFTGFIGGDMAVEAISLGIRGIVLKELAPELLVRCVREVQAGHQWIERNVAERAFQALLSGRLHGLTPREVDIVSLAAKGRRNKQIACELGLSEGTVKVRMNRIFEKLAVTNRVELANLARAERLV